MSWDGFYAGLSVGSGFGEQTYYNSVNYDLVGQARGLFAGYNYAVGSYVLGAELAASKSDIAEDCCSGYDFGQFIDLKFRVGYPVGKSLIYGLVGYTTAKWDQDDNGDYYDVDGYNFGIGVDYAVSDKFVVGLEVLSRQLETNTVGGGFEADPGTVSLRAAYKF